MSKASATDTQEQASQTFDLKSFFTKDLSESGVEMVILNPIDGTVIKGDDGKPWALFVQGTDSDKWKAELRKLQKAKRGEENQNQSEALVGSLIVGASNNIVVDKSTGETWKWTPQNATKLMVDYPWIKDQVNVFANDRANFLQKA